MPTTRQAPRSRRLLLLSTLVLAALAFGAAAFVILRQDPLDELRLLYNEQARLERDTRWTRAPSPLGVWEPLDGDAAEDYRSAWQRRADLGDPPPGLKPLALRVAAGQPPTSTPEPPPTLPAACASLGLAPDLLRRHLPELPQDPRLCEDLLQSRDALRLLRQGSQRQQSAAPHALFDPWTYTQPNQTRPVLPFLALNHSALLLAEIERLQGRTRPAVERLLASLRFSEDLEHGAGLLSALIGAACRDALLDLLAAWTRQGALDADTLRYLSDALQEQLQRRVDPIPHLLRAELLLTTLYLLPEDAEGFDLPPQHPGGQTWSSGPMDRLLMRDLRDHHTRMWREQLQAAHAPFEDRRALTERQAQEQADSINPLLQIAASNTLTRYEARLHASWTRQALLITAISYRRYLLDHPGATPTRDDLRSAGLPTPDASGLTYPISLKTSPPRVQLDVPLHAEALFHDAQRPNLLHFDLATP